MRANVAIAVVLAASVVLVSLGAYAVRDWVPSAVSPGSPSGEVQEYYFEDTGPNCTAWVWVRGAVTNLTVEVDPREDVCSVTVTFHFVPLSHIESGGGSMTGCGSGGGRGEANGILGTGIERSYAEGCGVPLN